MILPGVMYIFTFLESIYLAFKVILAGKKETVSSAIQKAERFRTELLRRGVLLVPVIWGEGREPQIEKKGFGAPATAAAALPSIGVRSIDFHPVLHLSKDIF